MRWEERNQSLTHQSREFRSPGLQRSGTRTRDAYILKTIYKVSTSYNSQGCRGPGPLGSPHLRSIFLTEPVAHPVPWSGDWTDLGYNTSDPWSCASQTPGPAPPGTSPSFADFEGATDQYPATSAAGAPLWSHPPTAWSTASWDCSAGTNGATYWDNGLGGEARADYKMSWGGSAGSNYTTSWNTGLQDCSVACEAYQSAAFITSSKSSQQSDRATLSRYRKTNHRGKRLQSAEKGKSNG